MAFQDRYRKLEFRSSRDPDDFKRVFPLEVWSKRRELGLLISMPRIELVKELHVDIPRLIDLTFPSGFYLQSQLLIEFLKL